MQQKYYFLFFIIIICVFYIYNYIRQFYINTSVADFVDILHEKTCKKIYNINNKNIFVYWTGKKYSLIEILYNIMKIHSNNNKNYNVHFINDENIKSYIDNLPDYFNKLEPAHKADYLRVMLIYEYGGIWLDSDTLVMDNLQSLFDLFNTYDGFFIKENNNILCNGVFGSNPKTKLMAEWKTQLLQKIGNNINIEWAEIGNNMLEQIYNENPQYYDKYKIFNGLDTMYPVNWDKCVEEYINKPYDNYKTIIRDYQPIIVLVNSVYKKLNNLTIDQINNSNYPLNYFINKSLTNNRY